MPQHRAHFDAAVTFVNGGGLQVQGFRLDLPGPDADEGLVGRLLVQHLGLALVDEVAVTALSIHEEAHRGSRGIEVEPPADRGRLVDLSHPIRDGLLTHPGLPGPQITPFLTREASRDRYAAGTEFAIDSITMLGNTGTYLDSPFHRYADGVDLAGLPLETLVDLPAEVLHLTDAGDRGIGAHVFLDRDVAGRAVLLHTGWDRHFGSEAYGVGAPFLTAEGAAHLVEAGAVLVGIDSVNVDDLESGGERPAHSLLLGAGVHVLEHLTGLGELPPRGARITAVPPRVEGFGTFPVRAFARV